jgi:hypothetical protein
VNIFLMRARPAVPRGPLPPPPNQVRVVAPTSGDRRATTQPHGAAATAALSARAHPGAQAQPTPRLPTVTPRYLLWSSYWPHSNHDQFKKEELNVPRMTNPPHGNVMEGERLDGDQPVRCASPSRPDACDANVDSPRARTPRIETLRVTKTTTKLVNQTYCGHVPALSTMALRARRQPALATSHPAMGLHLGSTPYRCTSPHCGSRRT